MSLLPTKTLGLTEVSSEHFIHFPEGLYGFHLYKEFALIHGSKDAPFIWLQSVEKEDLAFVLLEPEIFCKKNIYTPIVAQSDLEALGVSSVSECKVYVIITIPRNDPNAMTANLQGPILIHTQKKIGRQIISLEDSHEVRVSVLEQLLEAE